jgi:ABC-type bacteriocin/lantibiotic exporter with double-glycine peptidase domain
MILNYHRRKTTVAEVRETCSLGRDGLSGLTIVRAARGYGLRVRAYSIEVDQIKFMALPAIVHWGFNHFVVLESLSARWAEIVDPARGRVRLTLDEFKADFTGVILTFEPGNQFQGASVVKKATSIWSYFTTMFSGSSAKAALAQILGASLLLQVCGLAVPVFTKVLVDQVAPLRDSGLLSLYGMAMVVMVLAQSITSFLRSVCLIYLRGRLDSQLMAGFVEHLLSLPFQFFQQRASGDLLMRLTSNNLLRETLTNQTLSVILDGLFMLLYLYLLLMMAPEYGLLALAVASMQAGVLLGARRAVHHLTQRDLAASAEEQSCLIESIKGVAFLKASGAEDRAYDRWSNLFFKRLNISLERGRLSAMIETAIFMLRSLAPVLLLWLGATYVIENRMSVGMMLAMNALAAAFLTPVLTLVASGQQLQVAGAHLERISDVLEAEPEQPAGGGLIAPLLKGQIELRNVSFQYSGESAFALKNISCRIEPGQKVALVGATGSGKSTLAAILLGLFRPTQGEVYYDGIPLRDLNYQSLRNQFGVVLQDPVIFSGPIRQNITFGLQNYLLQDVMEAAKEACLHDEITRMPMGYETVISEGGTNLSGGQRQRLALARALVRRPSVLLLDEATSHLDSLTEMTVDQNLGALSCTRIVIAHRMSTIRNADQILALKDGEVVEHGTHEELLGRNGYYAELLQSKPFEDQLNEAAGLKLAVTN